MTTQSQITNEIKNQILTAIRNNGGAISAIGLMNLIKVTNQITAPTLVVLHDYVPKGKNVSNMADYKLNVATKYENAKVSTQKNINSLTSEDLKAIAALCTVDTVYWEPITLKVSKEQFCADMIAAIPQAIEEMKVVKPKAINEIRINKVLKFNVNTGALILSGELVEGGKIETVAKPDEEITPVASSPKTIVKKVITKYLGTRTSKIRTFDVSMLHNISVKNTNIVLNEV